MVGPRAPDAAVVAGTAPLADAPEPARAGAWPPAGRGARRMAAAQVIPA
jgi:hypothetical protein